MGRKRKDFTLWQKRGIYYCGFYDGTGKRVTVSLETEEEPKAQKLGAELAKEFRDKPYHIAIAKADTYTLDDILSRYIADKSVGIGLADRTLKAYNVAFSHARKVIGKLTLASEIDALRMHEYVAKRHSEGASPVTIENECIWIAAAFRHASDLGLWIGNASKLIPPGVKGAYIPRDRFLSPLEVKKVLDVVARVNPERLDYVITYLSLGIRKQDIYSIKGENVDLRDRTVRVLIKKKRRNQPRWITVALSDRMVEVLSRRMQYRDSSEPLFEKLGECWSHQTKRWARLAKIPHFTIHDLRRSTGSLLASEGVSLRAIAEILGHSNIQTTYRTYSHLLPSAKHDVMNKLPI